MHRDEEIEYARQHNIPVPATVDSPYSIDENLWGRSVEAGILEDPWLEPPEDAYQWTTAPQKAPDQPTYVEIDFEQGIPVALDGRSVEGVQLIARLNQLAGANGVGRIDHVENRLVGIKSREVYEAPAAVVLHRAHAALETMTLEKLGFFGDYIGVDAYGGRVAVLYMHPQGGKRLGISAAVFDFEPGTQQAKAEKTQ